MSNAKAMRVEPGGGELRSLLRELSEQKARMEGLLSRAEDVLRKAMFVLQIGENIR